MEEPRTVNLVWEMPILLSKVFEHKLTRHNERSSLEAETEEVAT